jgi:hypothetical protein
MPYEPLLEDVFGYYFLLFRLPLDVGCMEVLSPLPSV